MNAPAPADAVRRVLLPAHHGLLDDEAWRDDLVARLRAGGRLVTLFGRPAGAAARLTAVVQGLDGALAVTRTDVDPVRPLPSLTPAFPVLHVFERELHERLGLIFEGHPWLKPVRFERGDTDAYPFFAVEGREVHEVQVGPIHAGVIEPGAFRFQCHGEEVLHLEIHLGYQHRGVERLLLGRDPRALAPLVETVAGDTSIGHAWAYAAALEALADVPPSSERDVARAVLLELERIAMHLAGLAGMATDVGFLQGGSTYGRLRTTAINTSQRLCGSRFGRGAVRPAGSRARLDDATRAALAEAVALLRTDGALVDERFTTSATVRHRLAGTGRVSADDARALGLVGPAARACGVRVDAREGTSLYPDFVPRTRPTGDCLARAELRIAEIRASLDLIEALVAKVPDWRPHREPVGPLAPEQLAIAVVEGWRGEVVHALETDGSGALVHYKVQDPSLRNWTGLALAVRGEGISDFPICNKSFDLSYCGNDL